MPSSQELRSAIEHTTRQFLGAYKDAGEKNDPAIINRDVTDSCKRYFLPAGVLELYGAPADSALDNAAYEQGMAKDLEKGRVTRTQVFNLAVDTESRKSAATTITDMTFKDGDSVVMEHSWVLDFNEDGSKVSNVVEFCDMDGLRKMFAKVYTAT
ncbi:hypothetical protein FAVG1_02792 [Fusarium avenaceum]|nr:hypothetical protein FAVG1_02792 [Fusarium avenaceum]